MPSKFVFTIVSYVLYIYIVLHLKLKHFKSIKLLEYGCLFKVIAFAYVHVFCLYHAHNNSMVCISAFGQYFSFICAEVFESIVILHQK